MFVASLIYSRYVGNLRYVVIMWKRKTRVARCELRAQIHELRAQIHKLRVPIHKSGD